MTCQDLRQLPWDLASAGDLTYVRRTSSRVDPLHGFDWTRPQPGRLWGGRVGRDSRGRLQGKCSLHFQVSRGQGQGAGGHPDPQEGGAWVTGTWAHGRRQGAGSVHCPAQGVETLEGTWVGDRLQGLVTCRSCLILSSHPTCRHS